MNDTAKPLEQLFLFLDGEIVGNVVGIRVLKPELHEVEFKDGSKKTGRLTFK